MNRARERGRDRQTEREQTRAERPGLAVTDASVLDCSSNTNHNLADTANIRLENLPLPVLNFSGPSLQDYYTLKYNTGVYRHN